jgi:hypothetical protein
MAWLDICDDSNKVVGEETQYEETLSIPLMFGMSYNYARTVTVTTYEHVGVTYAACVAERAVLIAADPDTTTRITRANDADEFRLSVSVKSYGAWA